MMQRLLSSVVLSVSLLTSTAWADLVNINQADAAALQQNLKGIGKVKADAIIAYRKEHGAFKALEDIKEVKGIGDGLFAKIKTDISLTDGLVQASDSTSKKEVSGKSGKSDASSSKTASADKPMVKAPSDDSARAKGGTPVAANSEKSEKTGSK